MIYTNICQYFFKFCAEIDCWHVRELPIANDTAASIRSSYPATDTSDAVASSPVLGGIRNQDSIIEHTPEGMDSDRQFLIIPGLRPHPVSPNPELTEDPYLPRSSAPHRVSLNRNLSNPPSARAVSNRTIHIVHTEYRKRHEHHQLRSMFIPSCSKPRYADTKRL